MSRLKHKVPGETPIVLWTVHQTAYWAELSTLSINCSTEAILVGGLA